MKRTLTLLTVIFLVPFATKAAKPNIIHILADDLGWMDLAVQGSRYYETPNIDRLAAQGTRFDRYYNCQNCQPTRAALMSGQYSPRTGVYTVGGIDRFDWKSRPLRPVENISKLPLEKITIAQSLKAAGYTTAMFGKWHLGEDPAHHPKARGFDEAIVSMGVHFDFKTNPKVDYPEGEYLADFLTDQAAGFIRRNRDRPFFLYLAHFAVHEPIQAKAELIQHFKPKPASGGQGNPTYAAMVASVDQSVGRLMAVLEELGIADNTVLVSSSDNGGVGGYAREDGLIRDSDATERKSGPKGVTDNAPLRSGKGSLYEGGIRAPLIVRWPGVVKAGTVNSVPAIHVDLYPTFLEIAGARPPEDHVLDGESLMPLLRDPAASLKRDAIYQHFPGYLGSGPGLWRSTPVGLVISGDWKLMEFFEDHHFELYHLRDDIGETTNLAEKLTDKTNELHAKMVAWREAIKAPMPTPNPKPQRGNAGD